VLERAGLVSRRQEARSKPFSLEREAMADVAEWVERYRRHWEESFDRLALLLDDRETIDG
jgi:hypothetical protein